MTHLDRWTGAGLLAISAASLAYELALTRLLSLQQFHHFAFLVVSLAVLASAAGGVLRALLPPRVPARHLALATSLSLLGTFAVLNLALFDSYSVAWDLRQGVVLLANLIAAGAPFLFVGWLVAGILSEAGANANRAYAVNLIGAAAGVTVALMIHTRGGTLGIWMTALSLSLLAAACFADGRSRIWMAGGALAVLAILPSTVRAANVRLSPYKPLAVARLLPQSREPLRAWGMGSQIDVIESTGLRSFPGLSLQAGPDLPRQAGLFLDGDGPVPLTLACPDSPEAANLAQHLPSSLAASLRPGGRVLVLDAGGGLDVLAAVANGAGEVWASARSPETARLLLGPYRDLTCGLATLPGVHWLEDPPRAALAQAAPGSFDVVLLSLSDPYRPVTAGAYSLHEDFLWTEEGLRAALRLLKPDGVLSLTRWLSTPPAEEARAFLTLLEAVEDRDGVEPRLLAYRGMRTATILYSAAGWSDSDTRSAAAFLQSNAFDAIVFSGMPEGNFNSYNQLPHDSYRELFEALLHDPAAGLKTSEADLRPATDDRPFFFHFFRWQQLPETLAGLGLTWEPFGGSGYLLLLGLLGTVGVLAVVLGVSPAFSRRARRSPLSPRWAAYFVLVGGGFMLVEVALIQRLTVLLVEPAVSVAVVVSTLLLASGVGSMLADRLRLRLSLLLLMLALLALAAAVGPASDALLRLGSPLRQVLTALLLVPAGFLMGVPFSGGLIRLTGASGGQIAWAWAVNGGASGVAGVLTALISLQVGLGAAIVLGAAAYGLAALLPQTTALKRAPT